MKVSKIHPILTLLKLCSQTKNHQKIIIETILYFPAKKPLASVKPMMNSKPKVNGKPKVNSRPKPGMKTTPHSGKQAEAGASDADMGDVYSVVAKKPNSKFEK